MPWLWRAIAIGGLLACLGWTESARAEGPSPFEVPKVEGIAIDGELSDWGQRGFRIGLLHRVKDAGGLAPRGGRRIRLGWDKEGLLVRVQMRDDRWVEHPEQPWRYDSLELYMASSRRSKQRFQAVIAPGMSDAVAELVAHLHDHRARKPADLEIEAARTRRGDTARIEARLPWANLGIAPEAGREAAFQIMVNDNDEPGSDYARTAHDLWYPVAGAARKSWKMHTIRLARKPSPPYRARARPRYEGGRLRIEVQAAGDPASRTVRIASGGETLASTPLRPVERADASRATLSVTGRRAAPLRVLLGEREIERVPPAPQRPFLICRREQFEALRARAEREPWRTMKDRARERVAAGPPSADASAPKLTRYLGAAALLYILEPEKREAHTERVRDGILQLADVGFDPTRSWRGTVPPMGAAFVAILALDIVYDDLSEEAVTRCRALIDRKIDKIDPRGAWLAARIGTHGTWRLFQAPEAGDTLRFRERFLDPFYENYLKQMTPDGVTTVSPGYGFARLGSGDGRPQKTGFADVLEQTGVDQRYYDNPRLKRFYRWLYGHSVTPAKDYHLFGDVGPQWDPPNGALLWRVGRFDRRAAAHAAWLLDGKEPPGHILSYLLMEKPLPDPLVPTSRLFPQGEAVLREPADSADSLGAALYNITESAQWHAHQETNAISLAAYGNRLLVNGGWLGEPTRSPWRNNTISLNRKPHEQRTGAGLTEGLTSSGLDYACADSGKALGEARFLRSVVLVHGTRNQGGYFLVLDEIDASAGAKAQHYLQWATETKPRTVEPKAAYEATIDHYAEREGVKAAVLYAHPPASVSRSLVPSGSLERTPDIGRHYRLKAVYPLGDDGARRVLTVIFPFEKGRQRASLERIPMERGQGAVVGFGEGVRDVAIEAAGASPQDRVTHEAISFRGRAMLCRARGDATPFYFVRRGRAFRRRGVGFASDGPVSIHMRGESGQVTGEGAEVTLRHPGVDGVRIDGERRPPLERGEGWVRVRVPAGRHDVTLETDH